MKKMDLEVFINTDIKNEIYKQLESQDYDDLVSTDLYDDQDEYDEACEKGEILNTISFDFGKENIFAQFYTDHDVEGGIEIWYGPQEKREIKIVKIDYVEFHLNGFEINVDCEDNYKIKVTTDLDDHTLRAEDNN